MSEDPHVKAILGLDIQHFDGVKRHEHRIAGAGIILVSFIIMFILIIIYKFLLSHVEDEDQIEADKIEMFPTKSDAKKLVASARLDSNLNTDISLRNVGGLN